MILLSDRCFVHDQVGPHPAQEQWIYTVDWEGEEPHRVLFGVQCVEGVDDTELLHNCIGVVVLMQHLRKLHGPMKGLEVEHELASAVVVEENFHNAPLASQMVGVDQHSGIEVSLA